MMRARNLFLNLFLVATLFTLIAMTSCKNILGTQKEEPLPENPATENSLSEDSVGRSYARLILGIGVAESSAKASRTILPDATGYEKFTYILHCETSDVSVLVKTFHKEWESYEKMKADADIVLELGLWELTLSAKNGDVIVFSEKVSKTLVEGVNSIVFDLKSGTGDVDVTLSYPDNSGISKIQAAILDISSKSPISGFGFSDVPKDDASKTARYSKTGIPAGNYLLKFQFLNGNDEEIFIGFVEALQIRSNLVSRANLTISKLATTASKYGDYGFATMLKSEGGGSVIDAIETAPKNMPASAFYWRVESDTITGLSIDEDGCLTTDDAISDYPATAKVIATPKSGGESIECMVLVDDDLSLSKTELQGLCTAKGIDYETMTEFEIPYGYKTIFNAEYSGTFASLTYLETVTIPETIETIGNYSFQNCTALKTISENNVLPKTLKSINKGAFNNCTSLTKITIPGTMESIGTLDDYTGVFEGCIGLQEIIIEEGVKTIGNCAFKGSYYVSGVGSMYNTSIKKISISRSVETIGVESFMYMQYRTNSADIPNAPEVVLEFKTCDNPANTAEELTIQGYAFQYCHGFRTVTLPNNLRYLGTELDYTYQKVSPFEYCKNLKEVIFEEDSICEIISYGAFNSCNAIETIVLPRNKPGIETKIGYAAFQNNKKVTSLTIPGNVVEIGEYSFDGYENLAELNLEEGLQKIKNGAFATSINKYPIRNLVIPSTVTSIGTYAFYHFTTYRDATDPFVCVFKSTTPVTLLDSPFRSSDYDSDSFKIFVPESAIYDYYECAAWKNNYLTDNLRVEGKNTVLLKPASGNDIWFDTNGNGIKDEGEKDYCFFTIDTGATDNATFDASLLPKPIEAGKTSHGIIQWWDYEYATYANVVKQIKNPKGGGELTVLYANVSSGISIDSLGNTDISTSYNYAEKTLTATDGYTSYKWFVDGVEQSETSRILSLSTFAPGLYKVVVFAQDSKGNVYSESHDIRI